MPAKKDHFQAIDTSQDMQSVDIRHREDAILNEVIELTHGDFNPTELLWRSDYFGTGKLGAFHYQGIYKGKAAVLKIQGAKPQFSEQWMIEQVNKHNKSKIIRPPHIFYVIPWSDERGYEALLLEFVSGEKVIPSKTLLTQSQIHEFIQIYQEYRQNMVGEPWLPKPEWNVQEQFAKFQVVAREIKPNSPFRKLDDSKLIEDAIALLTKVWSGIELEFQHGHFSAEDLIKQGDEVILFSNLFWKWKPPFSDAVFAYHWIMYSLAEVKDITERDIDEQRSMWLRELSQLAETETEQKLLHAALLERAVAGLLIDAFAYIDERNSLAGYMVETTREEVERLMKEIDS